ncbi:processed acidic surface protein [Caenibacillus caldisaponilyticus]|uniref:processed acidic surface protein n=1 Tax=Caenibacillus caldisaponilyticus TaxID=1674942 RepID=UPI001301124C|nr:processed acidic surface protein [Caenibacillus caldisaponilyticus]
MKRLLPLLGLFVLFFAPAHAWAWSSADDQQLEAYLKSLHWTRNDLEQYLEKEYDTSIKEFGSFAELKDFLGEPLNDQTLQQVLDEYGLTKAELIDLLAAHGRSLDDYKFVDDLVFDLDEYTLGDTDEEDLSAIFESLGLTDEEIERVFTYLDSLDPDQVEKGMESIADRLIAFSDSLDENAESLTRAQAEALAGIFEDMLKVFQMHAKYYLVSDGHKKPITLAELFQMKDIGNATLLIELYDKDGNLLADLNVTPDLLNPDLINQAAKGAETTAKSLPAQPPAGKKAASATAKGGRLPDTASHVWDWMAAGGGLLASGGALLWLGARKRQAGVS